MHIALVKKVWHDPQRNITLTESFRFRQPDRINPRTYNTILSFPEIKDQHVYRKFGISRPFKTLSLH